jgi:hypothetical protein
MDEKTFLSLSFAATIAYGLLALFGLLWFALSVMSIAAAVCALLAIGAAYVSQSLATGQLADHRLHLPSVILQYVSVGLFLVGLYLAARI